MPDTLKTIAGVALAFALGAACRWVDIPVPAPNKLIGAVLVVAVTLGYLAADKAIGPTAIQPAHDTPSRSDEKPLDGTSSVEGQ